MKKVISMLIVLVVLVASVQLSAGATAVTTSSAEKTYIFNNDDTTVSEISGKDAFDKLFKSALSSNVSETLSQKAMILVSGTAEATYYVVYSGGEQLYLSTKGFTLADIPESLPIGKITTESWNTFVKAAQGSSQRFDSVPSVFLSSKEIAKTSSTYAYRKSDSKFTTATLATTDNIKPVINLTTGKELPISYSLAPSSVKLSVFKGKASVWQGGLSEFSKFMPEKGYNGEYTLQVVANYKTFSYKGAVTSTATVKFGTAAATTTAQKDEIKFVVEGSSTYPGEVTVLRGYNIPSDAVIKVTSDIDFAPKFFKEPDGSRVALMPVSYYTSVGNHYVDITVGEKTEKYQISVNDKKFQIQNLTASSETTAQTIANKEANAEFAKYIDPVKKISHDTAYWKGTDFVWPVAADSRVTTQFGMVRYVNGAPTSSRHGAIDFAVPQGTAVKATNNGKVVYAGFLKLTGYTVIIEHGYGLKSWHYHMESIDVKTDENVKVGQKIGQVGSTGFSTGPHLHFGMSVNNVYINPTTVINKKLDLFTNK